jgi:hypothetical protein
MQRVLARNADTRKRMRQCAISKPSAELNTGVKTAASQSAHKRE